MLCLSLHSAQAAMAQTAQAFVFLIFGGLTAVGTSLLQVTAPSERHVENELEWLCEKLDEEEYDEARAQWKVKMLPVEKVSRQNRILRNMWSEKQISFDQWQFALNKWVEDEFEKHQRELDQMRKSRTVVKILEVIAFVIIDKEMVVNSGQ